MQSADMSAESGSPPKSRDGSSAASPAPDSWDNATAGAIRLAVHKCVAQEHDGIESLRRCSRAARGDGVKPEHVVLLIHAAWDEYTAHTGLSGDHDMKRLRLTGVAFVSVTRMTTSTSLGAHSTVIWPPAVTFPVVTPVVVTLPPATMLPATFAVRLALPPTFRLPPMLPKNVCCVLPLMVTSPVVSIDPKLS